MGIIEYAQALDQIQDKWRTDFLILFAVWIAYVVFSIAVVIYMFRDATARGKSGRAAAILAIASCFYDFRFTIIVLCTWILFRPELIPKAYKSKTDKIPSDVEIAPSSQEYLQGLEQEK